MNRNGFSLVELMTVVTIAGILMGLATLYFKGMTDRSAVEGEIKTLYADLVNVRSQALYQKRGRSVKVSGTSFQVFSSNNVGVPPVTTSGLKYPVVSSSITQIDFDTSGVITFNGDGTTGQNAVCVQQANDAAVDSIAMNVMQLQMGKKLTGAGCTYGNVSLK